MYSFDGDHKPKLTQSLGGKLPGRVTLEDLEKSRQERLLSKERENSIVVLQKYARFFLQHRQFIKILAGQFKAIQLTDCLSYSKALKFLILLKTKAGQLCPDKTTELSTNITKDLMLLFSFSKEEEAYELNKKQMMFGLRCKWLIANSCEMIERNGHFLVLRLSEKLLWEKLPSNIPFRVNEQQATLVQTLVSDAAFYQTIFSEPAKIFHRKSFIISAVKYISKENDAKSMFVLISSLLSNSAVIEPFLCILQNFELVKPFLVMFSSTCTVFPDKFKHCDDFNTLIDFYFDILLAKPNGGDSLNENDCTLIGSALDILIEGAMLQTQLVIDSASNHSEDSDSDDEAISRSEISKETKVILERILSPIVPPETFLEMLCSLTKNTFSHFLPISHALNTLIQNKSLSAVTSKSGLLHTAAFDSLQFLTQLWLRVRDGYSKHFKNTILTYLTARFSRASSSAILDQDSQNYWKELSFFIYSYYLYLASLFEDDLRAVFTNHNGDGSNPFTSNGFIAIISLLVETGIGIITLLANCPKSTFKSRRAEVSDLVCFLQRVSHLLQFIHNSWILFAKRDEFLANNYETSWRRRLGSLPNDKQFFQFLIEKTNVEDDEEIMDVMEDGEDDDVLMKDSAVKMDTIPGGSSVKIFGDATLESLTVNRRYLTCVLTLKFIPFVLSYAERYYLFCKLRNTAREMIQGRSYFHPTNKDHTIRIQRGYLYDLALQQLGPKSALVRKDSEALRRRLTINFYGEAGALEAGIDGGGLFREFMTDLIQTGFDPERGFFLQNEARKVIPNPASCNIFTGEELVENYFFLGSMVAKCLFEGLVVDLPLADFFLSKLLASRSGGRITGLNHLASLDKELYSNLLELRNIPPEDFAALELDFTINRKILGHSVVKELVPGGASIPVTASNWQTYVRLVADYRLNKDIEEQTRAFAKGFYSVIRPDWIRMFDFQEFQNLISGSDRPIDLDDFKLNSNFANFVVSTDPNTGEKVITDPLYFFFWSALERLNEEERGKLLQFITGSPRPPLTGFKAYEPLIGIQKVGFSDDLDHPARGTSHSNVSALPTASTCMNLFKLPAYKDEETTYQKIKYAINSNAGFELQ